MHQAPVKYLILIDAVDGPVARLFDGQRGHVIDIDASSEEVAVMTQGLQPAREGQAAVWARALAGHNPAQRAAARVYTLPV